ncbi:Protein of unknown function DUF761, plant [Dillenia turbinata]|uniref:Uncharacterized protein n=1 Tax=Dillenia turbinata TaxID=194707 RepID=A0AAN8W9I9_9MAGN
MSSDTWVLGKLKRAVKKLRLLLNFNINRWLVVSMIRASSRKTRLSFNDRPGLRGFTDDSDDDISDIEKSPAPPKQGIQIQRTISNPSEEDINKKADLFIENFYKQLRMERQVSLDLRKNKLRRIRFQKGIVIVKGSCEVSTEKFQRVQLGVLGFCFRLGQRSAWLPRKGGETVLSEKDDAIS